jgi:hypothetical protein
MKQTFNTAVPYALAAGALALMLCGYARADDQITTTYVETTTVTSNTPVAVDPFSPRYPAFPAMAPETAGVIGHSFYCTQHYNQPGCQTVDTAYGSDRSSWREHRRSEASESFRSDTSSPSRY